MLKDFLRPTNERLEPWGRILYDHAVDEFLAQRNTPGPTEILSPLSVGCLITGRCNLKCAFCYGNYEALPHQEIDAAVWKKYFEKLRSWGVMRVDLSGGEPTIRSDWLKIVNNALASDLNVVLSTNGMLLKEEHLLQIPPQVRLHVSIDSADPFIHARSRIRWDDSPSTGGLNQVLHLIASGLRNSLNIRVLTRLGPENENGLLWLAERLALAGVVELNISRTIPAGRAKLDYKTRWMLDDAPILEQIHEIRDAFPWMNVRFSSRTEQNGYFLLVLPDGSVATQFTDENRDKVILGHLDSVSLEQLRKDSRFDLQLHAEKWIGGVYDWQDHTSHPA